MTDAEPKPDELLVAIVQGAALVCVCGRGTFKTGPALKQFSAHAIGQGCGTFLLDMHACVGMDSTFMGVLAGLALRLKRESGGSVVMLNLSPKTASLLQTLGLDQLIELHLAGDAGDGLKARLGALGDYARLPGGADDRRFTLETMLEAHQDLVRVAPQNLPKFKSVIEYVSQDLRQIDD